MRTAFLMLVLAVVAVAPVFATGGPTMQANVPFDFVVNGKVLPAGEYQVADVFTQQALHIRTPDGKKSALALTQVAHPRESEDPMLTFEQGADGRYHLIATSRSGVARELKRPQTRGAGVLAYIKATLIR